MKHFSGILVAFIITASVFCSVFYLSCKKSKCGSTVCQNGGTCDNSICVCPTGYSGNGCQTGWSDEFIGTYKCKRGTCTPAVTDTTEWQSSITKDATNGGYTVDISNFNNAGNYTIAALIDSLGNISISPAAGVSGTHATGKYSNGVINLQYTTAVNVGTTFTCTMVMTKQ